MHIWLYRICGQPSIGQEHTTSSTGLLRCGTNVRGDVRARVYGRYGGAQEYATNAVGGRECVENQVGFISNAGQSVTFRLTTKGSVVDEMIKKMENYANDLERIVSERTTQLEEAQRRADNILSQV